MNDPNFAEIAARPNYPGKARDLRVAMAWLKRESPKHDPNDRIRKRSLWELAKLTLKALEILVLAGFVIWYVGYLIYQAVQ